MRTKRCVRNEAKPWISRCQVILDIKHSFLIKHHSKQNGGKNLERSTLEEWSMFEVVWLKKNMPICQLFQEHMAEEHVKCSRLRVRIWKCKYMKNKENILS